ncbi:MAG: DUF3239 domain-containing protein [Coriobacteriia bacterium]|nr:DUF3239 domain-containing protein [Coriobacteriia bacterium]MCL2605666.1 DUF3239 domain-containing protein [Coriobacteriia bacterium]
MLRNKQSPASLITKITVDAKRVRKYDTVYRSYTRWARAFFVAALFLLAGAAAFFWFDRFILAVIAALISMLLFYFAFRVARNKLIDYQASEFSPAIIHRTDPLTVIALVPLLTFEVPAPQRYGCQEFEVKELPGHKIEVGERIPCAVDYNSDNQVPAYFSSFNVRPLCWATRDLQAIQHNIDMISNDGSKSWEALDKLAKKLPFSDTKILYILDEKYRPLISRNVVDKPGKEYFLTQKDRRYYLKDYSALPDINAKHPDVDTLIRLAYQHQVAEYFLGFKGKTDKAYVTPFNNPESFDSNLRSVNPPLQSEEVVFVAANTIVTNKGVWSKKGFLAWNDVHVFVNSLFGKDVCTQLGKKDLCTFALSYDLYPFEKESHKELGSLLKTLEIENLTKFWLDVKRVIGQNTLF